MKFFTLPTEPKALRYKGSLNKFYTFFRLNGGVHRSVLSPYLPSLYLGIIRLLFGTYILTSFIVHFTHLVSQKPKFIQKQGWKLLGDIMIHCFIAQASYFLISGYHTIVLSIRQRRKTQTGAGLNACNPLAAWLKPLQLAHLMLQTTVMTFPLFCTIVYCYWTLPAQPKWAAEPWTRWSTITFYMLNSVLSYIELFLSASRPRPWSHLMVVISCLGLYLAFHSILVTATGGKVWIYTVLKFSLRMNEGWISAVRVFGLCALATGSFCVMQFFLWIKCRYLGGLNISSVKRVEELPLHNVAGHADCHQNP